jgi:hypothetical protein
VKSIQGIAPETTIDEIIPLGDEVVDGAARSHARNHFSCVAERHTTVHAARALGAELFFWKVKVDFFPVFDARERRAVCGELACVFLESGRFAHNVVLRFFEWS